MPSALPLRRWLRLLLAAAFIASTPIGSQAQALVDPAWLQARQGSPGLVLLDASPMPIHRAGHIPGAVNADLMFGGTRVPTLAEMQARMRAWGLNADSRIVVYDNQDTMWATRIVFDLHMHGVPLERLHVLDGGLKAWQASGGAVGREGTPAPAPGNAVATLARPRQSIELPEFLAATGRAGRSTTGAAPEFSIVEALEPAWYFGQRRFFDRGGHVPNARMWSRLDLHTADGRFKPPAEIRRMAAQLGLNESTPVLTYCGGGVAATLPWFALHVLLGWPEVRVYIGSQREWLRDERVLPMWTWAEPGLLRQAEWLVSWNDDLLRMTGSAQLGVLDVRPAAEHALGHVPHAFNLPPERWEALRRDPAALRATLAASGLDPRHEIVLVGRGGLDPAAALAWATLEALGHRRVSLLLESTDEWALRGHPLAKPPAPGATTPPRRAQPGWAALIPAPHPARAATGDSPRQTLRVDSSLAAATTADTITLPWTEFVNADRSLKPPHQIHERLVKAGLSRWADVRIEAQDPAEAAAALFVLRLVGWPSAEVAQQ